MIGDWYCEFCAGAFLTPFSMRSMSPSETERNVDTNDVDSAISINECKVSNGSLEDIPLPAKRVCKKRTFLGDEYEEFVARKKPTTVSRVRQRISGQET